MVKFIEKDIFIITNLYFFCGDNKSIWCESTFNNKPDGIDLLLYVLIILFINFIKVYKAWLWLNLIHGINKNEGSNIQVVS